MVIFFTILQRMLTRVCNNSWAEHVYFNIVKQFANVIYFFCPHPSNAKFTYWTNSVSVFSPSKMQPRSCSELSRMCNKFLVVVNAIHE